jgi:hypothetical protein
MDYNILLDRNNANAQLSSAEYNPSNEYINALSNIKVNPIVAGGNILWSDLSKNSGSILNVLPPALPERSTFVRRPRSLTEQSDLSEVSVDEADRNLGTLRGDTGRPPVISPSKAKQKVQEQEDFDSLLSEFNNNDINNTNKTEDVKEAVQNNNDSRTDNTNTAAANSALDFLGITGDDGGSNNSKKKKKKKKKGKKTDNNSGGGNSSSNKNSKKKKTPTASQIAAAEAAARKTKNMKKKRK